MTEKQARLLAQEEASKIVKFEINQLFKGFFIGIVGLLAIQCISKLF